MWGSTNGVEAEFSLTKSWPPAFKTSRGHDEREVILHSPADGFAFASLLMLYRKTPMLLPEVEIARIAEGLRVTIRKVDTEDHIALLRSEDCAALASRVVRGIQHGIRYATEKGYERPPTMSEVFEFLRVAAGGHSEE
jgi:hypothetical protein